MKRSRIILISYLLLLNQLASGQTWNQGGNAFAATGKIGTTDNNNMEFYTNNLLRARINNTGILALFNGFSVVTGTATFANGVTLDNGAPYLSRIFTGGTLQLQGNATTAPQVSIHNYIGGAFTGSSVLEIGTANSTLSASQNILAIFGNTGIVGAVFKSNGNVGIGTANPQSLLAVKGTVTAQKVVVTQTGWSDYVFDKNYSLLPITELKSFIVDHKHLPDLPSAESVAKNGVDLGDNQSVLLKKIEELTLYIIQLNAKLEQQSKEIQSIQNGNASRKQRSESKK